MNEIEIADAVDVATLPTPPEDSSDWPAYIERLLAMPLPDDYHSECEVFEATPRCLLVFLRVSESFDDNPWDAYQEPIEAQFKAERDELAAVLDERWGPRIPADADSADFSAVLLESIQAWPVYAWAHGERVVLLGVQKTEREHPYELCAAVASRWTDDPPADEALWPLFVRQLRERSSAEPTTAVLWRSREKPASQRESDDLRWEFAEYRENLCAELSIHWGPPLEPSPADEDAVTPALEGLGAPAREAVDVWRRGDRLVVTGVTTEREGSLAVFATVTPEPGP